MANNLAQVRKLKSTRKSLSKEDFTRPVGCCWTQCLLTTALADGHPTSTQHLQRQIAAYHFQKSRKDPAETSVCECDLHFILHPPAAAGPSMLLGQHFTQPWLSAFPIPSVGAFTLYHVPQVPPPPFLGTQGQWFHWLPHRRSKGKWVCTHTAYVLLLPKSPLSSPFLPSILGDL